MDIAIITLFIIGGMFFMASHIPVWFLSGKKPNHQYWKLYSVIAISIWVLILILANIELFLIPIKFIIKKQ